MLPNLQFTSQMWQLQKCKEWGQCLTSNFSCIVAFHECETISVRCKKVYILWSLVTHQNVSFLSLFNTFLCIKSYLSCEPKAPLPTKYLNNIDHLWILEPICWKLPWNVHKTLCSKKTYNGTTAWMGCIHGCQATCTNSPWTPCNWNTLNPCNISATLPKQPTQIHILGLEVAAISETQQTGLHLKLWKPRQKEAALDVPIKSL